MASSFQFFRRQISQKVPKKNAHPSPLFLTRENLSEKEIPEFPVLFFQIKYSCRRKLEFLATHSNDFIMSISIRNTQKLDLLKKVSI